MTRYTLTILEEYRTVLQESLLRDDREYAAILLCGRSKTIDPWTGELEERFLVREIIEVDPAAFYERTPTRITWSTTPFFNALKRAEERNFAVAVAHSHPSGSLGFSTADDVAERELFQIAFDRLESDRPHLSLVMDRKGDLIGRAYGPDLKPRSVDMIRIIGERWRFVYPEAGSIATPEFDRQVSPMTLEATTFSTAELPLFNLATPVRFAEALSYRT